MRIPTVGSPAVTFCGSEGCLGQITVRGPGEKVAKSFSASGGRLHVTRGSMDISAIWTIRGLSCGLPLARKIL